ncbi:MAG: hypothetical protein RR202_09880 [Bacteroidales bacterium]
MKKFTLSLLALVMSFSTLLFADDDKHELTNYTVSVPATDYKSSRFLEKSETNGKDYIHGKGSSYNKKGEAISGKALWPYADYVLSSKLMGGTYTVTVHYRIDKDKTPDNPRILVGMDLLEAQELQVEKKLFNTVKATFNTKLLKGKNHTLKVWFPCEGVEIQKFEVRRAIITKKK